MPSPVVRAALAVMAFALARAQDASRWRVRLHGDPDEASLHLLASKFGGSISLVHELNLAYATGSADLADELEQLAGVASVMPIAPLRFDHDVQHFEMPDLGELPEQGEEGEEEQDHHRALKKKGGKGGRKPTKRHTKKKRPTRPDAPDLANNLQPLQWSLKALDVAKAWKAGYKGRISKGRPVRVAVLDGGFYTDRHTTRATRHCSVATAKQRFYTDHPNIRSNVNRDLSKSLAPEDLEYRPNRSGHRAKQFSHGTWIAGVIAGADRARGTVGVAPEAELILVKQVGASRKFGRGTWIAGVIAGADRARGTVGVAPEAELILVKVYQNDGSGDEEAMVYQDDGSGDEEAMVRGIVYAAKSGADIICMPVTGVPEDEFDLRTQQTFEAFSASVTFATLKGVTVIASAGNRNFNFDNPQGDRVWPAQPLNSNFASELQLQLQVSGVITVSATGPYNWWNNKGTNLNKPASYSNYGTSVIKFAAPGGGIDALTNKDAKTFAAPGGGIDALTNKDAKTCNVPLLGEPKYPCGVLDWVFGPCCFGTKRGYTYSASYGTSASAAHVAGVAALIMDKAHKRLSPRAMYEALRAISDDLGGSGADPRFGLGLVNAGRIADLKL
ncbi:peptidase S8/S53 domain-containing protein [Tribonema minus]|uniref:subtilisin n=1 Tax=Tribonema minus TaxID=303371 RepID=A0A836C7M8_9STRA|nr:peptidase S8/S53 domain-containing protein [Tribonema minus]